MKKTPINLFLYVLPGVDGYFNWLANISDKIFVSYIKSWKWSAHNYMEFILWGERDRGSLLKIFYAFFFVFFFSSIWKFYAYPNMLHKSIEVDIWKTKRSYAYTNVLLIWYLMCLISSIIFTCAVWDKQRESGCDINK